jgi:AcrR family transcriptional regulator
MRRVRRIDAPVSRPARRSAGRKSGQRQRAGAKPRAATRLNIIETAERLFGIYGIHGVSLRQIGLEAGSANKGAIPYHFKNLKGLVRAIFEHRLPVLEARRREMLVAATEGGRSPDVRELLTILFTPLTEQVDQHGLHSYAAFLSGLSRFHQLAERRKLAKSAPVINQAVGLLARTLTHLSPDQFRRRFVAVNNMVIDAIVLQDEEVRISLDELLDMAAAALQAGYEG